MDCKILIFSIAVFAFDSCLGQKPLTLCTLNSQSEICDQLRDNEIKCIKKKTALECMLSVHKDESQFTSIPPEEALLGAKLLPDLDVIGDIRPSTFVRSDNDYEMVVVIPVHYNDGVTGLKGKRFCHPGFNLDNVNGFALKEFEKYVLKRNGFKPCTEGLIAEMHIRNLNEFFGPSCYPGPWVSNPDIDKELKSKYPNLTAQCDNQPQHMDFNKTVEFLKNGKCDFALTTLNSFLSTFTMEEQKSYKFLCRNDGSAINSKCDDPWTKQNWPLVVANKHSSAEVAKKLNEKIPAYIWTEASPYTPTNRGLTPEEALVKLVLGDGNKRLVINDNETLEEFIKRYRHIPNPEDEKICGEMTWCTINNQEQEKCLWASQAAVNQAIQPIIACHKADDKLSCLKLIEEKEADVVSIDDYGYIAYRRDLTGISYPDTDLDNLAKYAIVVKHDAENVSIKGLKDKKGCFSEFGSNGQMSFINLLRQLKLVSDDTCSYGKLISDFVNSACIPGAHDEYRKPTSELVITKACQLCQPTKTSTATTCNADETNVYYGNMGALKCLSQVGDFAIISFNNLTNVNQHEYRILCRNGSVAEQTGFEGIDEDCFMNVVTDSEVVARRKDPRLNDFSLAFEEFEQKLNYKAAFRLFDVFNGTTDLLFLDSTRGLETRNSTSTYVQNYIKLFQHAEECSVKNDPNSANIYKPSFSYLVIFFTCVLYYFF